MKKKQRTFVDNGSAIDSSVVISESRSSSSEIQSTTKNKHNATKEPEKAINSDYDSLVDDLDLNSWDTYPNVINTVKNIVRFFLKSDQKNLLLAAETQSGKTEIIKILTKLICADIGDDEKIADQVNIIKSKLNLKQVSYLLNAADCSLKNQTVDAITSVSSDPVICHLADIITKFNIIMVLEDISQYILDHNASINESIVNITKKRCKGDNLGEIRKILISLLSERSLLMLDEAHADDKVDQTMAKTIGLIRELQPKKRILLISATPYVYFLAGLPYIYMNPGEGYTSIQDLLDTGRIRPMVDISDLDTIRTLKKESDRNFKNKGYYIIVRAYGSSAETINTFFKKVYGENLDIYTYYQKDKHDINEEWLNKQPKKPALILIKGKLRMGKQINTKYVAQMHDLDTENTSTCIQGLVGRATGYGKHDHQAVVFSEIEKCKIHIEFMQSVKQGKPDLSLLPKNPRDIKMQDGKPQIIKGSLPDILRH